MALLAQQFSANVAPLVSRSKYTKPLLCQGFFVFGTAVLSERRTADFTLQIHKAPALSGVFCFWALVIALLAQQFSASVAPLVSRSKYTKPLLCQGFFVYRP